MSLPFDIFDCICQILAHGSSQDSESLRALSQTCKSMVPLARKRLFSSIELETDATAERLDAVLSSNPDIARYVRHLEYGIVSPIPQHIYRILELVKQSSALHSLHIWSEFQPSTIGWKKMPLRMQELVTVLIQMPSITDLDIWRFNQLPSSILLGCTHITNFSFSELVVAPNEIPLRERNERVTSRPLSLNVDANAYGALESFMHDGTIGFGGVQDACFTLYTPGDVPTALNALRLMVDIQTLSIGVKLRMPLAGLGTTLMQHPQKKLKKLYFSLLLEMDNENPDPLLGLNNELKIIAGNNIIEELALDLSLLLDDGLNTNTDDISTLDALLTTAGAFPALKRVSVDVLWTLGSEDSRSVLLSLAEWEDQFVKLSQSQNVEFTFNETTQA